MNAHQRAEKLCRKAESVGLCHPTEPMIAQAIHDALSEQWTDITFSLEEKFKAAADYLDRCRRLQQLENL